MKFIRRSFLLSVSLSFLLGYAIFDLGHFTVSNLLYYENFQRDRLKEVANIAKLGKVLIRHEELPYFEKRLKEAKELHEIDFYLLKKGGQVLAFDSTRPSMELLQGFDDPGRRSDVELYGPTPHIAFSDGQYFLAIGFVQSRIEYLHLLFERNRGNIIFDIAVVVFLASAVAFFFFADVRKVLRILQSPNKSALNELKPEIAEAKLVLKGLKSYESHVHQLQREQGLLSIHVASAVRAELHSGKTPPYQFRCTMVRTDINQYSTIYSKHPVEEFMTVLNEFFTRASIVIARYRGYVTDFVGDEIIYYFKDEDHLNSAAAAVAAIRDINAIASEIHERVSRERGFPFTVKSAMACGSLRFGPHINGFALSGGVFVETVRILSHVEEKSENSVYMPSRLVSKVAGLCNAEERKTVELKGMQGSALLYRVTSFHPLDAVLDRFQKNSEAQDPLFYSEPEVLKLIEYARVSPDKAAQGILALLAKVGRPFQDQKINESYVSYLRGLMREGSSRVLSQLISTSQRLIDPKSYSEKLHLLLQRCLESEDRRVVANTVDALIHFAPLNHDEVLVRLLSHPDNRVQANALVKVGMVDLGRQVVSGLDSMLRSQDSRFVASGIYALASLIRYHRSENPTVLQTHKSFIALLRTAEALRDHADPMVQRQLARIVFEKSDQLSAA